MKIENIPQFVLDAIRQRICNDENDSSKDSIIEHMTPIKLTEELCAWELGDSSWARRYINIYERLKVIDGGK